MKRSVKMTSVMILAVVLTMWIVSPVLAQDKPADNMEILRNKVKADKKLLVAANMELTESEAKVFWPVYEAYQKDLMAINERIFKLIHGYAADYRQKTLTDDKAKIIIDELIAIEQSEVELKSAYVPKLNAVLPLKKVARYLQIENKIRALIKFDLAQEVPLVP